jgi:prepilin-type N-terminal cleavage/methylation domain-containing protein
MKKKFNRGFTLIELLVVIAIIGILASVILASLSSARAKGTDAAMKADLSNARAQAEIFYDGTGNQSYLNVCTTAVNPGGGIKDMIADAAVKFGNGAIVVGTTAAGGPLAIACHDSLGSGTTPSAWAASVPLKAVPGS